MTELLIALSVLVGFIAGYFLAFPLLVVITVVCVVITVYLSVKFWNADLAGMIPYIFFVIAGIGNVVMWVTYYFVSRQTFVTELLHAYVLR